MFATLLSITESVDQLQKKTQDADTFNFPTTIKLPTERFGQNIIPKSASTPDVPYHLKSKLIKTLAS